MGWLTSTRLLLLIQLLSCQTESVLFISTGLFDVFLHLVLVL